MLYAFSVFVKPLEKQFGWSSGDVLIAYAIVCLVFGLVTFPAGRLSDRFGPRKVVLAGGLIMAFGFFMVSTITPPDPAVLAAGGSPAEAAGRVQLYLLYLYYGVIAGLGGGLVYLPPIATAPKWWPDRRALATGFAVVGLGLGSFVMGPLATSMIASPAIGNGSALPVFGYVGIAMLVVVFLAALCQKEPPPGYRPAGWVPPVPVAADGADVPTSRDHTHEESRRTPQFWLLWLAYFGGSFAGLMCVGMVARYGITALELDYLAGTLGQAVETLKQLPPAELKAIVATIPDNVATDIALTASYAVSTLAIGNAAARILIGPLVDRIGTKPVFVALFSLQTLAFLALYQVGSVPVLLWSLAAVIGWNFGAMFVLFPSATLQYYGATAQASNYGLVFTAWGIGGFIGVILGGRILEWTGSYLYPFLIASALLAASVVILASLKAPDRAPSSAALLSP